MVNRILIGIGVVAIAFIIYKILSPRKSYEEDIDKELDEVVSSDKYKVKGQYD